MNAKMVLGCDTSLLSEHPELECQLQPEVIAHLLQLKDSAAKAGFSVKVASSYRSFERQLTIWNNKALGLRPVLDERGNPLDIARLSETGLMFAILRWSALPGASRHHWGTDLDIYDASRMAPGYQVQLTCEETRGAGPFAEFHRWLTAELASGRWDFYRPYSLDCGGVAPEPWHLSYAPLARLCEQQLTEALLHEQIAASEIALKSTILAHLPEIYHRFVRLENNRQHHA